MYACSWQPLTGINPFCVCDMSCDLYAMFVMRVVSMVMKVLYIVFWRQIGLQFLSCVVSLSCLGMSMVLLIFHDCGILFCVKHALNIVVRVCFMWVDNLYVVYGSPSGPEADEFFVYLSVFVTSVYVIGVVSV